MTAVIIEAAINGATPKTRNPHVPLAPGEITADALACCAAGAAIIHNHIDDFSLNGGAAAARYLEGWRPVLRERPDAVVYPTVALGGDVAERFGHVTPLAESGLVRMGVLDPGSVNLGAAGDDGLPGPIEFVYANSYGDIRYVVDLLRRPRLRTSITLFQPPFPRPAPRSPPSRRPPPPAL